MKMEKPGNNCKFINTCLVDLIYFVDVRINIKSIPVSLGTEFPSTVLNISSQWHLITLRLKPFESWVDNKINDTFILRVKLWKLLIVDMGEVCRFDFTNKIGQNFLSVK